MLQPLSGFTGYAIHAIDGDLGHVEEFYFDDQTWNIRYMIARTGGWLKHRKVLLSVIALGKPDWMSRSFPVNLTRDQVRNSPEIDTESPVQRHHELALHTHYQWPFYWDGTFPDVSGLSSVSSDGLFPENKRDINENTGDQHLQSTKFLTNSPLYTTDGELGHLEDFIIDTESWMLNDLVMSTGIWFFGKKVLVPVTVVRSIDNDDEAVHLNCTKEEIMRHHEFDPLLEVMTQEEEWVGV